MAISRLNAQSFLQRLVPSAQVVLATLATTQATTDSNEAITKFQ